MLNNLSFRAKLIIVRSINLCIISIFAVIAFNSFNGVSAMLNEQVAVASLLRAQMTADMVHDGTKGNVLYALNVSSRQQVDSEARKEALQKFQEDRKTFEDNIAILEQGNLSEQGRAALTRAKPDIDSYLNLGDKIITLAFQDYAAAQAQLPIFMNKFIILEKSMDELGDAIEDDIKGVAKRNEAAGKTAQSLIIITALIGLLTIYTVSVVLVRSIVIRIKTAYNYLKDTAEGNLNAEVRTDLKDEISQILSAVAQLRGKLIKDVEASNRTAENLKSLVKQIQGSAVHVNSSINQLSATSREQESMVSEVAATVTQVATSSKEIASTTKELLRTMNEAAAITETSGTLASSGQQDLVKMGETMRGVMDASASINTRLAMLNEKAGNISQVTTTIAKVADQTNLLSLNAAIEAEKAGEYGRGFAIVATEIRRLADQTAVASYDIELIVKEMQSAVSASVMGMDKFSEEVRSGLKDIQQISGQLYMVIEQVQILIPKFEVVNQGMSSQTDASEQISQGLTQVNDAMHQLVDTVRLSTASVQDIAGTSNSLSAAVAHFKTES